MTKRLFPAALMAGLTAGFVISLTQVAFLLPIIDYAEFLEMGARSVDYVAPSGPFAIAFSDPARLLGTFSFDVITGVAFALLLGAAMVFHGRDIDWKKGLAWGLGGWAAFSLAPSIGLPPAPPGSAYVDLADRQLWWWLCVSSTSLGLVLVVFIGDWAGDCGWQGGWRNGWWPKVVGAGLVIFPHVFGAPLSSGTGFVPHETAFKFALISMGGTFLFWLCLGGVMGFMLGQKSGKIIDK